MSEQTKLCTSCKETKPLSEFRLRKGLTARKENREGQPFPHCMACEQARSDGTPGLYYKRLVIYAKRRAENKALACDLNPKDLAIMEARQDFRCALTGYNLTHHSRRGNWPTNATLDRLDPAGPYTLDNIRIVTAQANSMRNTLTDKELVRWCQAVIRHLTTKS